MCDCHQCNMSEEDEIQMEEEYLWWEYQRYVKQCKPSEPDLSFREWLKTTEAPH